MTFDPDGKEVGREILRKGAELQAMNALSLINKKLLLTEKQRDDLITILGYLCSTLADPAIRELRGLSEIESWDLV